MEILKIRKLAVAAAMFALFAAQETRGMNAYLKQTGPSPLRFALISAIPASFILPETLVERQTPTNSTEIAANSATSGATNAVATEPLPPPAPVNSTAQTATNPQNSSGPKPAASDMLVVSPQMLTEFFKPVGNETNSQGNVIVPVPVGFTPPSVTPSSRATYNSPNSP